MLIVGCVFAALVENKLFVIFSIMKNYIYYNMISLYKLSVSPGKTKLIIIINRGIAQKAMMILIMENWILDLIEFSS